MSPYVKYPQVKVQLVGKDGNTFAILGSVCRSMRSAKLTQEQINEYRKDAMSGDYDHLLAVTMDYVVVL